MKNEFALAFNEVVDRKELPKEIIMEALEAAMISAYRKAVNASQAQQVIAKINLEESQVAIFAEKEVVEEVQELYTEVTLEEARKFDPNAQLGDMVVVETTPENFGRVAAQTARQVIQQRMREAERSVQFEYYSGQVGDIVNGIIQATNVRQITLGLDKKAEGIMPQKEMIKGERFHVHDRIRALLLEVKDSPRGPQIILSRSHKNFLRRLLEGEVPEIYQGFVEIRSIAREPGQRSKVAVYALQPGIDPVGACVGVRGVRIQAIVRELHDEKIDVIEWNPDPMDYIAKALSPARVVGVFLDKYAKGVKTATVVVPEDQLSLAIGRDGQNARLAAKLTGWRIDIKSLVEAAGDAIHKLQSDPDYAEIAPLEAETIPAVEAVLAKKAEGRTVVAEEYTLLTRFVTRIEKKAIDRREADVEAEQAKLDEIRVSIPPRAFSTPLEELGLSPRFALLLTGEGYTTIGDLLFQMRLESDTILQLNGIGPKAMEEIEEKLEAYLQALKELPPEVAAEIAATAEMVSLPEGGAAVSEAVPPVESAEGSGGETSIEAPAGPEVSLEEIFSRASERIEVKDAVLTGESGEDEEEKDSTGASGKKKKKKKKSVEMEFDPETNMMVVRGKHKHGEEDSWGVWDNKE